MVGGPSMRLSVLGDRADRFAESGNSMKLRHREPCRSNGGQGGVSSVPGRTQILAGRIPDLGVCNVRIPRKGNPQPAGEPRNTSQRFGEQSSGATASKAESAPSNADAAETAPASTAPKAPRSGSATGFWHTTWSRSAPWQREDADRGTCGQPNPDRPRTAEKCSPRRLVFRSK